MYGEQSDLLVAGRLKWDGCMDCFPLKSSYHVGGFDDFLRFAQIMHWVCEKGQEHLESWDTCYPIGSFYEDCHESLSLTSEEG